MLTRIAPILAVAYCTSVHSEQFGAQMPTRSPVRTPVAISARASRSTSARSSAYVHRLPCATSTSASRSANRSAVASKLSPIVVSRRGVSVSPRVCERLGSSVAGCAVVMGGLPACAVDGLTTANRRVLAGARDVSRGPSPPGGMPSGGLRLHPQLGGAVPVEAGEGDGTTGDEQQECGDGSGDPWTPACRPVRIGGHQPVAVDRQLSVHRS